MTIKGEAMQDIAISVRIGEQQLLLLAKTIGDEDKYAPEIFVEGDGLATVALHRMVLCLWKGRRGGVYNLRVIKRRITNGGVTLVTSMYPTIPGLW